MMNWWWWWWWKRTGNQKWWRWWSLKKASIIMCINDTVRVVRIKTAACWKISWRQTSRSQWRWRCTAVKWWRSESWRSSPVTCGVVRVYWAPAFASAPFMGPITTSGMFWWGHVLSCLFLSRQFNVFVQMNDKYPRIHMILTKEESGNTKVFLIHFRLNVFFLGRGTQFTGRSGWTEAVFRLYCWCGSGATGSKISTSHSVKVWIHDDVLPSYTLWILSTTVGGFLYSDRGVRGETIETSGV